MKKTIDARGVSCPLTRKVLNEQGTKKAVAIADSSIAIEDVSRLINNTIKIASSADERGGVYYINISKNEIGEEINVDNSIPGNTVILFNSNVFGRGEDKLGNILMKSFIYTLTQTEGVFKSVIFINSAVLLTTEGSEVISYLRTIEERGIEILSCSTCLDYYNLTDKLRVGSISNMFTITERIIESQKLISV